VSINLGGVGQQNRKSAGRNVGGRLFDIIDLIVSRRRYRRNKCSSGLEDMGIRTYMLAHDQLLVLLPVAIFVIEHCNGATVDRGLSRNHSCGIASGLPRLVVLGLANS